MIRNLILSALLCMAGAAQLHSGEPTKQQVAKRNYLNSLQSEHEGVRNSAIFRVLQYKAAYPEDDCNDFLKRLQWMSLNDSLAKNRMHAFLACAVLQDAKLLAAVQPPSLEDGKDEYFAGLQDAMQRQWIATRE